MNKTIDKNKRMPGLIAPAFSYAAALIAFVSLAISLPAVAQQQANTGQPSILPPASMRPVPDSLEMSKLVWSTIIAVDHANRSGNYSVLRDMSAQGFQINNTAATLATTFSGIRNSRINLSNVLLVPPTYSEAPRQVQADIFEVKGLFVLRPTSIFFNMYFQWEQGQWKLFGIDLQPISMQSETPEASPQKRKPANR
ncbi:hypothetical protein GRI44_10040 [Altererythrobacter confluentis]|uniref:Uncharacterized protein n=1 Tax=Allopontixanthobacter confluentis TaxID=1849021 RepID=A0A6L7GJI5_9SPHN|nr:hypothetical protein [Allopontixanthobacter confluentis]MXP15088.1 hypothetical protein [Allopontixanthobacter confluentis]